MPTETLSAPDTTQSPNYARTAAVFAVVMLAFSIPPIVAYVRGESTKDYGLWYVTGQQVLHGEKLYPTDKYFPFMYPPFAAILLAPLSVFGEAPMMLMLALINSAAWAASVLLSVYLVTGKVLGQNRLLYLVPALCTAAYTWDTYFLGQPNLLLLAMMLGAFACLKNRREWGAGGLVALAVAVKAFPIMAIGYFIYRRHWTALGSMLLFLVLFFVLIPFAARGLQQGEEDLTLWTKGMVLNYDHGAVGQRTERAYSWKNQSLIGLANRLLRHKSADEDLTSDFYVNVADLGFGPTNVVIVTVALGLCLLYVAVMPPTRMRTPLSDATEYAMLLLLILAFSPYSFGYFFVWLLYPLTVLVHLSLAAPKPTLDASRLRKIFFVVVAVLGLSLVFHPTFALPLADAYGNNFVACMILFGALAWQLNKGKNPAVADVADQGQRWTNLDGAVSRRAG